jgi:hypothetical protein
MEIRNTNHQFVIDPKGKKIAVILPIKEYERIIAELEELDDIRLYDEAKVEESEERISISDYRKKRDLNRG